MSALQVLPEVDSAKLQDLRQRMNLIQEADPNQVWNDYALKRYLRAFNSVDISMQSLLKTAKWRAEYNIVQLTTDTDIVKKHANKCRVLRHRDCAGRPVIYIPAKNHNANNRDIDELTRYIVYCLEMACGKCFEEVTDTLCIVFDLAEFSTSCMDYQLIKNMIWLLGRHYPERLGVCLILNSPSIFSTIWPVIRQLLDEKTASKVIFVDNENETAFCLSRDILKNYYYFTVKKIIYILC